MISVARYWPKLAKIRLADIWIPQGSALYIPPKPDSKDAEYIDLHHNRNSAQACWGKPNNSSVKTQTLLRVDGGYFYWYWNRPANDSSKFDCVYISVICRMIYGQSGEKDHGLKTRCSSYE